jgi:acyl-CoA synthetase (AMP-forming)/AMP-acid ligase II
MTLVAELVDRAARRFGARTAVVDGERHLSFTEVNERANRLANALLAVGSPSGAGCVALLMHNRLEYVECDFAIAKAGKVRVGINPRLVAGERTHILNDSGAETLIFDAEFEEFAHDVAAQVPTLRASVMIGGDPRSPLGYESLLSTAQPSAPRLDISETAPSFIMYTSGTSGRAKGATATNASRIAGTVNMLIDELDIRPGDAMLHVGSMSHGSGSKVLAHFIRGARNVTARRFEPDRFYETVRTHGITGTFVVPTMIGMLLDATAHDPKVDTGPLKTMTYGGAPITPDRLLAALDRFGDVLVQVYGSCEAPHPVMVLDRSDHAELRGSSQHRLTSVGRKATLVDVRLAREDGTPAAVGDPGEMWVRGPNVMSGYWRNASATAEVFADGWYKTGDVAVEDAEGFYYIVDRARDVVISGGLNVYPAQVEAAISMHSGVQDVAVIGVPDDRWGEAVKAVVVRRPGSELDEAALIAHCAEYLAGYKKPQSVEFVDGLPMGSTGKVLKRELRDRYWEGVERRVN